MQKTYFLFLLGSLATAACSDDKYVVDVYSTMRYDALALPAAADTMTLQTVDFVSASEGFVGGDDGALFATTDAGQTWVARPRGQFGTFYKLAFSSATTGWAGTDAGLCRTTDGGRSWRLVPTYDWRGSLSGTVYDVQFVTPQVGYAVGSSGTINKTTNGGQSWTSMQNRIDKRATFRAVSFTSADSGSVVGGDLSHWQTTDGGRTWTYTDYSGRPDAEPYYDVLRYGADDYLLAAPDGFRAYKPESLGYYDEADEDFNYAVRGLARAGTHGPVVAVGYRTIVRKHQEYAHNDHSPWVYVHAPDGTSYRANYYAADFADDHAFYAVGARGVVHRFHYQ